MKTILFLLLFTSCVKTDVTYSKRNEADVFPVLQPFYIEPGQSNTGADDFPPPLNGSQGPQPTQAQIDSFGGIITGFKIFNPGKDTLAFYDIHAGWNCNLFGHSRLGIGPEVSLCTYMKNAGLPPVYVVKFGVGSTNMYNYWKVDSPGNVKLKQTIDKALRLIISEGKMPLREGFIWMQGEGDATVKDPAPSLAYLDNLTTMFNDFDTWYAAEMVKYHIPLIYANNPYKKIIGRINAPGQPYRNNVRNAEANYCAIPGNNAVMINTDTYPLFSNIHYTNAGQFRFGLDIFNVL